MKATVDHDLCTGCGICVDTCSDVFELNADGLAEAKVVPVPPAAEDSCRDAAEACPVDAISVEE